MSLIFLLHMAVIIFMIRPRTSKTKLLRVISEITNQVPMEKLVSIVAIEAKYFKRKFRFDILCGFYDSHSTFFSDSWIASPSAKEIRIGYTPNGVALQGAVTMSHCISL